MSVIVSRALPDVRDGLKPVQRRILVTLSDEGLTPVRPYKKSAAVVGSALAKYHPHGDSSVYDAMVRLAQPHIMNSPLVDGQGNWGSADGDAAAAYRYTEARMTPAAMLLLADLDKNTVDWVPTFDAARDEPSVLPAGLPNLLLNGSEGIAVGMATKIPPHNLRELVAAISVLCDDPASEDSAVLSKIKGPDFPSGGLLIHTPEIKEWLRTGRGRLTLRGKAQMEAGAQGRQALVVTEVPYNVSPANLLDKVAAIYREGRALASLGGQRLADVIAITRNESSREGTRLVIELKKGADPARVLRTLYKTTDLELNYSAQLITLVGKEPQTLGIRAALQHYLTHRVLVVVRRTQFDLDKAEARAHIVAGLLIAIDAIDAVVKLIRKAPSRAAAKEGLQKQFTLSELQADAILSMRLAQLTNLDVQELKDEAKILATAILGYKKLLASPPLQRETVKLALQEAAASFGVPRRTTIVKLTEADDADGDDTPAMPFGSGKGNGKSTSAAETTTTASLTHASEQVTLLASGQLVVGTYGGKAALSSAETMGATSVWALSSQGKCIPLTGSIVSPHSTGRPVSSALVARALEGSEKVIRIMSPLSETQSLLYVMRSGKVKRLAAGEVGSLRPGIASVFVPLDGDDQIIDVLITEATDDVLLATTQGQALRTSLSNIPAQGRAARGVAGVRLDSGDAVVSATIIGKKDPVVLLTTLGLVRQTPVAEFPAKGRGTGGVRMLLPSAKVGEVAWGGVLGPDRQLSVACATGTVVLGLKPIPSGARAVQPKPIKEISGPVTQVKILRG